MTTHRPDNRAQGAHAIGPQQQKIQIILVPHGLQNDAGLRLFQTSVPKMIETPCR